jgi:molybdopterin synthase catalytic subunit
VTRGFTRITAEALRLDEHLAVVSSPEHGALVSFIGQVRDHDRDASGRVVALDYSAHPDAPRILEDIASRIESEHPGVSLSVSHRIGRLSVGDLALVAAVAAAHRAEAFSACESLIETVKRELPVWKKQHDSSGSHSWVGL